MKKIINIIYAISVFVVGTASVFSTSYAATISYQGTIIPPFSSGVGSGSTGGLNWVDGNGATDFWSTVTGSVGARGWIDEQADETDFWSFAVGSEGTSLDIWAQRGDQSSGLDTAFSIYSGITTADESAFVNRSDFGGIIFSSSADDELSNDGPFGDPALYNIAFEEGIYTIAIGGFASNGEGPFSYNLSIGTPGTAPSAVPLPGALLFFATGILGFMGARRGKQ
jgi:hypothetical protein